MKAIFKIHPCRSGPEGPKYERSFSAREGPMNYTIRHLPEEDPIRCMDPEKESRSKWSPLIWFSTAGSGSVVSRDHNTRGPLRCQLEGSVCLSNLHRARNGGANIQHSPTRDVYYHCTYIHRVYRVIVCRRSCTNPTVTNKMFVDFCDKERESGGYLPRVVPMMTINGHVECEWEGKSNKEFYWTVWITNNHTLKRILLPGKDVFYEYVNFLKTDDSNLDFGEQLFK